MRIRSEIFLTCVARPLEFSHRQDPNCDIGWIEMPQRSSLLPYRGMLSFLSKAREASDSETARVHHAAWRRGGFLAGSGAWAADGQAPADRIPVTQLGRERLPGARQRIPGRAERTRVCRREKHHHRIPLRRRTIRPARRARRRAGCAQCGHHRCGRYAGVCGRQEATATIPILSWSPCRTLWGQH